VGCIFNSVGLIITRELPCIFLLHDFFLFYFPGIKVVIFDRLRVLRITNQFITIDVNVYMDPLLERMSVCC
jgi:hypothetical protein